MFRSQDCITDTKKKTTCYTKKSLVIIAKALALEGYPIKISQTKDKLYQEIKTQIKKISSCETEQCWLTMTNVIEHLSEKEIDILHANFKPPMPSTWKVNPEEWLTNIDLEKVLQRYSQVDPSFFTYGAIPVDSFKQKSVFINCANSIYTLI